VDKLLFGTSGIRGGISDKVTTDLSMKLGQSLGTYLKGKGKVGVGMDARTSNHMLRNSFIAGLVLTGTDVVDVGLVPMPTAAYFSTKQGVSASVIITASHNPPTDNGFKFFVNGREMIRSEEKRITSLVESGKFRIAQWSEIGRVSEAKIRDAYLHDLRQFLLKRDDRGEGMRVLVDAANGVASNYTPRLLTRMGFTVTTLNANLDGHFPGRPAEPSPGNLTDAMALAEAGQFPVTLCHDGDGDRVAVVDEDGKFIDQNRVIALFAREEIRRRGEGQVLVSIDTSSVIDEVVKNEGGNVERAPLGSLQEKLVNKDHNIVLASEPWKPIFTNLGLWMDGIVAAARIAQLVNSQGKGSCKKLMKSIPEYPLLREHIRCPDYLKKEFMRRIRGLVKDFTGVEKIIEVDGVRLEFADNSYLLIRVSGTEPKARLYIGARQEKRLHDLADEARRMMKRVLENCSNGD
jgi:phosphopentomutase